MTALRWLAAALACAAPLLAGCEGEQQDGQPSTAKAPASFELKRCPATAWARGGGEDWEVAGVTCEEVGDFVRKHFSPHPGGTTQSAVGFTCGLKQFDGPYSALHVSCAAIDGRRFSFVFH